MAKNLLDICQIKFDLKVISCNRAISFSLSIKQAQAMGINFGHIRKYTLENLWRLVRIRGHLALVVKPVEKATLPFEQNEIVVACAICHGRHLLTLPQFALKEW